MKQKRYRKLLLQLKGSDRNNVDGTIRRKIRVKRRWDAERVAWNHNRIVYRKSTLIFLKSDNEFYNELVYKGEQND